MNTGETGASVERCRSFELRWPPVHPPSPRDAILSAGEKITHFINSPLAIHVFLEFVLPLWGWSCERKSTRGKRCTRSCAFPPVSVSENCNHRRRRTPLHFQQYLLEFSMLCRSSPQIVGLYRLRYSNPRPSCPRMEQQDSLQLQRQCHHHMAGVPRDDAVVFAVLAAIYGGPMHIGGSVSIQPLLAEHREECEED